MKTLAILLTILFVSATTSPAQSTLRQKQEQLLNALILVESGGNDKAIGDNGKAIGCLQIHKVYWTDAVERSGLGGSYVDCMRRDYAKCVVRAYMNRYAKAAWTDLNLFNAETVARIHNGGPKGYRKKATKKYWKKIKKVLPLL
tara:strand:- start:1686 stop:2117 length:432 start_codon:yes stop_codon:yes gene_type:complete